MLPHPAPLLILRYGRRSNGWPEVSEARLSDTLLTGPETEAPLPAIRILWPILPWAKPKQFCSYPCRSTCVVPDQLHLACIPVPRCSLISLNWLSEFWVGFMESQSSITMRQFVSSPAVDDMSVVTILHYCEYTQSVILHLRRHCGLSSHCSTLGPPL